MGVKCAYCLRRKERLLMCDNKPDSIFGSLVFNEDVMRRRLSNTCYRAWKQ